MLVLTRKVNEEVVIGDSIKITVTKLANSRVRIGVDAPPGVPIRRQELLHHPTVIQDDHVACVSRRTNGNQHG